MAIQTQQVQMAQAQQAQDAMLRNVAMTAGGDTK